MADPESQSTPGKRSKRRRSRPWHRVLGVLTVIPLIWVMVTGALLNHTVDWKLDQIHLAHPWLLQAYGMAPSGEPSGVVVGRHQVVEWDGQLFFDATPLDVAGTLVGAVPDGNGVAVVTSEAVLRLDQSGSSVEVLDRVFLPAIPLTGVSAHDGRLLLANAEGWHEVGVDWLEFTPVGDSSYDKQVVSPVDDKGFRKRLKSAWANGGLPASRVVLDLHAGRFLGSFTKYFYDVVVVCTLWLCLTGLILFFRKPRRNR